MSSKRVIDFLQNLTLVALTVSAIYLLTCFPMLDGTVTGRVQEFFAGPDRSVEQSGEVTTAVAAVHLVVTDQYEYGRYACLTAATDGAPVMDLSVYNNQKVYVEGYYLGKNSDAQGNKYLNIALTKISTLDNEGSTNDVLPGDDITVTY